MLTAWDDLLGSEWWNILHALHFLQGADLPEIWRFQGNLDAESEPCSVGQGKMRITADAFWIFMVVEVLFKVYFQAFML